MTTLLLGDPLVQSLMEVMVLDQVQVRSEYSSLHIEPQARAPAAHTARNTGLAPPHETAPPSDNHSPEKDRACHSKPVEGTADTCRDRGRRHAVHVRVARVLAAVREVVAGSTWLAAAAGDEEGAGIVAAGPAAPAYATCCI